jgi:two-component system, cell cycle sensor histidine kinase DivJ
MPAPGLSMLRGGYGRGVLAAIYGACAIFFIADTSVDQTLAIGVVYIPLVATSVFYRNPRVVWLLAAIASALVAVGLFLPIVSENVVEAVANRVLSIAAIWIVAALMRHDRNVAEQLAEQTRRAEIADQAKGRLLGNLSHELKTPLNAILGFSDLMLADCRPDQVRYLEFIKAGGRRLLGTFENLIDLTQLDERVLQAGEVDLAPLLREAVRTMRVPAVERRVSVTLTLDREELPAVRADPWAVRRIVENLLGNAIKFSNPCGAVEIGVEPGRNLVAVIVRDHGRGIAPDVMLRLGEPFFQGEAGASRNFEGMGTGLALSLRLATAMHGRLVFDSRSGGGTRARLVLPVVGAGVDGCAPAAVLGELRRSPDPPAD